MNFLMFKLVLEKAEEPEIKLPTSTGSWKKQESSRKASTSALSPGRRVCHPERPRCLLGQAGANLSGDLGHVGPPGQLRLEDRHHLAYVGRAGRTRSGHRLMDGRGDLRRREPRGQVGAQDLDFEAFPRRQFHPAGGFKLAGRVLALRSEERR